MRNTLLFIMLTAAVLILFTVDLGIGSVRLSVSEIWGALIGDEASRATVKIVRHIRLLKALVAILAGAALAVSGLQMQTLFRNPLAGPYVLGITSGASLGVALVVLATPAFGMAWIGESTLGIAGAAWVGAAAVLVVIAAVSVRIKDIMVILVLGMMFSSGIGAVVQVLQYLSHEDSLKTFVVWTMGSLGDVTYPQFWIMLPSVVLGLLIGVAAIKSLNLLQLGEEYAKSSGLNLRRARILIFASTALLAGSVTAFCGPIGFVGLAVPHVARFAFRNSDCRVLVPASMLVGIAMMLACDIVSKIYVMPINAVTALAGIPIVIWVVMKNRR